MEHAENFTDRAKAQLQHTKTTTSGRNPGYAASAGDRYHDEVRTVSIPKTLPRRAEVRSTPSVSPKQQSSPIIHHATGSRSSPLFTPAPPSLGPNPQRGKVADTAISTVASSEHRDSLNLTLNLEQKLAQMESALHMQKNHLKRIDRETRNASVFMSEIANAPSLEEVAGTIFRAVHRMKSVTRDGFLSCLQLKSSLTMFPPFYSWLHHKACWSQWGERVPAVEFDNLVYQYFFTDGGALQGRELQNLLDARLLPQAYPSWRSERCSVRGYRVSVPSMQMSPQPSARSTPVVPATARSAVRVPDPTAHSTCSSAAPPAKNANAWREEAEKWRHKYKKRAQELEEASALCEEQGIETLQWKRKCSELEAAQEQLRTANANLQQERQERDGRQADINLVDTLKKELSNAATARFFAEEKLSTMRDQFKEVETESARYAHLYEAEVHNGKCQEEVYEAKQRLFTRLLAEKEEEIARKKALLAGSWEWHDIDSPGTQPGSQKEVDLGAVNEQLTMHTELNEELIAAKSEILAASAAQLRLERDLEEACARLKMAEGELLAKKLPKEFDENLLNRLREDLEAARKQTREALAESARSATEFASQRQNDERALVDLKHRNVEMNLQHEQEIAAVRRSLLLLENEAEQASRNKLLDEEKDFELRSTSNELRASRSENHVLQDRVSDVTRQLTQLQDERTCLSTVRSDFERLLEATKAGQRRAEEDLERARQELKQRLRPDNERERAELEDIKTALVAEKEKCQIFESQMDVQVAYRETIDMYKETLRVEHIAHQSEFRVTLAQSADSETAQRQRADALLAEITEMRQSQGAGEREQREQLERECSQLKCDLKCRDTELVAEKEECTRATDELKLEQQDAQRRLQRDSERLAALQKAVESSLGARRDASETIDRLTRELQDKAVECEQHICASLTSDGVVLSERAAKDAAEKETRSQKAWAQRLQEELGATQMELLELKKMRAHLGDKQLETARDSNQKLKQELAEVSRQLYVAKENEVVQSQRASDAAHMIELTSEKAQMEIDAIRSEKVGEAQVSFANVEALERALQHESLEADKLRCEMRQQHSAYEEVVCGAHSEHAANKATQERISHMQDEMRLERARIQDLEARCSSESTAALRVTQLEFELDAEQTRTRELETDVGRTAADLTEARQRALDLAVNAENARTRSTVLQEELRLLLANSEKPHKEPMSARSAVPSARSYPISIIQSEPISPPPFGDPHCPWKKQTLAPVEDPMRNSMLRPTGRMSVASLARINFATETAIDIFQFLLFPTV